MTVICFLVGVQIGIICGCVALIRKLKGDLDE
jgi:hypothetical protein